MKALKQLGLALIALFALSAAASSVALGEDPTILPVPSEKEPLTFTGKTLAGTKPTLESTSGKILVCVAGTTEGEFTTQDHGKAKATATGCEEAATKAKCKSGATAGVVEGEGLIELVDILPAGTLALGVWGESFAVGGEATKKALKVSCGVLNIEVLGSQIGILDNAKKETLKSLEKAKTIIGLSHQTKGEQEIKECMTLKALCEKGPFGLKVKFTAEGSEELAGTEGQGEITFAKEVEAHF